jgi:hypothetical protein
MSCIQRQWPGLSHTEAAGMSFEEEQLLIAQHDHEQTIERLEQQRHSAQFMPMLDPKDRTKWLSEIDSEISKTRRNFYGSLNGKR